jgi:hypothetical protein
MRNKFPGTCYQCGKTVEAGEGHFERHKGGWRVQHVSCCLLRKTKMSETKALWIQREGWKNGQDKEIQAPKQYDDSVQRAAARGSSV